MAFKRWIQGVAVFLGLGMLPVSVMAQESSAGASEKLLAPIQVQGMQAQPVAKQVANAPADQPSSSTQVWSLPTENSSGKLDVLQLKDVDINDVLNLFSSRTGVNIIAGKGVQGRVTMFLRNVDVRTALALILKSNGFAYEEHENVLAVMPEAEYAQKHGFAFGVKMKTEVFDLSYIKAENIIKIITSMLTSDVGKVDSDPSFNKVIITDTEQNMERIRKVIVSLDKYEKEVLVEARIMQVTFKEGQSTGIDWTTLLADPHRYRVKVQGAFSLGDVNKVATIGTLDRDGYQAVLQALATLGTTKTLASPSIAVINNQEAKIHIGKTQPYVTTAQTVTASGPSTTAESVNFIDIGVKLNVTPMIHDDGYITMKIRPEVSTATEFITSGDQKNQIPIVNTSEVDTTIRVMDGVTIVIGGLIKDEATKNNSRIPFLGDMPLIGKAFRSDTRSKNQEELVIFLTPHIISGDVAVDPEKYFMIKDSKHY